MTRVSSGLFTTLSQYQFTSAVVKGAPSDHFMPLRMRKVQVVASSFTSQDSHTSGCSVISPLKLRGPRCFTDVTAGPSERPLKALRQVPPYLPTDSSTGQTNGLSGSRSSIGGRSPLATRSASMGASRYFASPADGGACVACGEGACEGALGAGGAWHAATRVAALASAETRRKSRRDSDCSDCMVLSSLP